MKARANGSEGPAKHEQPPAGKGAPSSARELLQGTAIGLLVTLALFGILEGATRIHHRYAREGYTAFEPIHLVDFARLYRVNPDYRSRNVRINTAGFRNDEEITREKPENVFRIALMGGSTVWGDDAHPPLDGIRIDNKDTIAAHLQEILNARVSERGMDVDVQVLNAGVVGYRLFQNLAYFDHRVADFEPDLVIAIDGHNDLDALGMGLGPYGHRREASFERTANRPTFNDLLGQVFKYVGQRSLFVRKAQNRIDQMFLNSDPGQSNMVKEAVKAFDETVAPDTERPEIEDWLEGYEATVRRLDASARIAGSRALFVVQNEIAGERHKELTPGEREIQEFYGWYEGLHTVVRGRLIARMNELEHRYGIWFEDITPVFEEVTETAYLDYTHLTSLGARVVAERLADAVESMVLGGDDRLSEPLPRAGPVSSR